MNGNSVRVAIVSPDANAETEKEFLLRTCPVNQVDIYSTSSLLSAVNHYDLYIVDDFYFTPSDVGKAWIPHILAIRVMDPTAKIILLTAFLTDKPLVKQYGVFYLDYGDKAPVYIHLVKQLLESVQ